MDRNITFLLGAGASALTIPTVEKFRVALTALEKDILGVGFLNKQDQQLILNRSTPMQQVKESLSIYSRYISDQLLNFSSIDTYARFLYYTNPSELPRLKVFLDFCFSYWQFTNGLDKRYDSLMSLLMRGTTNNASLPTNIKVLTWNYDLQLESCLARYLKVSNLREVYTKVNIYPGPGHLENQILANAFSVFKLNGSAQTYVDDTSTHSVQEYEFEFFNQDPIDSNSFQKRSNRRVKVLEAYHTQISSPKTPCCLTYSWDESALMKKVRDEASIATSDTDILIIIGYSFPLINRKVDEMLINNMGLLKEVYIQSLKETIQGVTERCKKIVEKNQRRPTPPAINSLHYIDEFFVPDDIVE